MNQLQATPTLFHPPIPRAVDWLAQAPPSSLPKLFAAVVGAPGEADQFTESGVINPVPAREAPLRAQDLFHFRKDVDVQIYCIVYGYIYRSDFYRAQGRCSQLYRRVVAWGRCATAVKLRHILNISLLVARILTQFWIQFLQSIAIP